MAVTAVGTPASPAVVTTGSVTGSWSGTQPRTAGDLLVAAVTAYAATSTTAISTPAGWVKQQEIAGNNRARTAFYTATAAGSDAAPNFTSTLTGGSGQMTCELWELSGANTAAPVDAKGTKAASVSAASQTCTTSSNVAAAGEYALAAWCVGGGTAQAITWTAGASWANQGTDGASTTAHAAFDFFASPPAGVTLSEIGTPSINETNWGAVIIVIQAPEPVPYLSQYTGFF